MMWAVHKSGSWSALLTNSQSFMLTVNSVFLSWIGFVQSEGVHLFSVFSLFYAFLVAVCVLNPIGFDHEPFLWNFHLHRCLLVS